VQQAPENQSAAQLTGHCKTGGIRSLAANRCAGEIVVVSKRGERQQSESGFEYTPNAVEGRRKGAPPKLAGVSKSAPAWRLKTFRWKSKRALSPPGRAPAPAETQKNR